MDSEEERQAYDRLFRHGALSIRDLDIDAFADGVVAHRGGTRFHENPYGTNTPIMQRLSWHLGWNERALRQR